MEIKVFAGTKLGYVPTKEEMDKIGGLTAGVCYLPDTIDKLFGEPEEKTKKREGMIKTSGHKSPFDHPSINLEINDIPKIVAMILNDEQMYTTSEKSARYKRMALPDDENEVYERWLPIFEGEIRKLQPSAPEWFTDIKIKKLAQENARYLTSVFTPTSMVYTMSYRQANIIYRKFAKEIDLLEGKTDAFSSLLRPALVEFNQNLNALGYIDEKLSLDDKNFVLKLFNRSDRDVVEQFGESYTLLYNASFAQLAQAHRHRTIDYAIKMKDFGKSGFYVPPILKGTEFEKLWLADCEKLADKIPQGMLVPVVERGTIEDFILKTKERNCTCVQLEIDNQTTASKKKLYEHLVVENPPLAEELKPYMKGSRCTAPDYKCATPCGYKDGVTGGRTI